MSVVDNVNAYKVEGHRHTAELEQELPGRALQLRPAPAADRPGDPRQLLRDARRGAESTSEVRELFEDAYARRAVRRAWSTRRRAPATCATPTARRVHVTVVERARAGLLRDRQPLEGRRRPGGAGPEPDARPARDGGPRVSGFFRSRWVEAPGARARARAAPRCPRAFAPPAWPPASSRTASTWACSSPTRPATVSAARFTTNARVGAPVIGLARRPTSAGLRAVVANSGGSNVGDGQRGLDTALAMQAGRRRGARPSSRPGRRGLDRRDRHRAAARAGAGRRARRPAPRWATTPPTSPRRSSRATAAPKRACLEVELVGRRRAALGPGQGRGHDRAALRHDVLLRADRRRAGAGDARPAHRRVRQALVRPHLGRRPALHQRHGLRAGQRRARACAWSPRRRTSCASARRSTRCCASSRSRSSPTARAPSASAGSWSTGRPDAVEPVARAIANSPLVKTALHGGDPNFGRILQAAGQAWPAGEPFVADLEIEGRQVVSAGDAIGWTPAPAELEQRSPRGRVRADHAGRGRRDRGLLQRPRARVRALQRGVHVMRDVATLLEALPYIREFHGAPW